jgi:uncharacterized protein
VQEMTVVGVRVELPANQPIVLLKETNGERYLPIWIGAVEATAIAAGQAGDVPPRPMTHDLIRNLLEALASPVTSVEITELHDGVFFADLVFVDGLRVTARPSDAIAIALRTGSPVLASDDVLAEAGLTLPGDEGPAEETEVERFREFLDTISPEDFDTPG